MDNTAKQLGACAVKTSEKELDDFVGRLANQNEHLNKISIRLGGLVGRLDGTDSVSCDGNTEQPCHGVLPRFNGEISENMMHINRIDDLLQRLERVA